MEGAVALRFGKLDSRFWKLLQLTQPSTAMRIEQSCRCQKGPL